MLILVNLFSHKLRVQQMTAQQELADLSDLIQEDMSGISLIKIYAQEENERQAFRQQNQRLFRANLDLAQTRNLLFPLIGGLAYVSVLLMLWQGSSAIAAGTLTIGNFIALILFVERLVFPTALLGFTITTYQRGEVSIDRVESVLSVEPTIHDQASAIALPLAQVQGFLKADRLTYTYPGAKEPALNNLSFTIHPGQTVAIVGSIGSGKTTLANALPRLLDISAGQLFLDGQDITQIRLPDLRAAIAYVPQESFLFSTAIHNNIRYGDPTASQRQVETSAQQAQIHAEILNFPQQYETLVGERGITLSGGQRQRTALARGLLVDAPILVLDDSLSSVDNKTALHILENLSSQTQRKTVLFITHQLSAAAKADQILVMDQGQIVQTGTHTALLQQPGLYQALWQDYQLEEILT
jgi:ATP-binding cassette, subfamily B, multidrug efflux pump